MKEPPRWQAPLVTKERARGGPFTCHAGLDLSRKRLDVCLLSEHGELFVEEFSAPPDGDGLRGLVRHVAQHGVPVRGVVESMTGARFVHDTLEQLGWEDLIPRERPKGQGVGAAGVQTDKIDARVLAVLSERDLVPAIWPPDPRIRSEREQARFRLTWSSASRCSSTASTQRCCPSGIRVSPVTCSALRAANCSTAFEIPDPWRQSVDASLDLIDYLEGQIDQINHGAEGLQHGDQAIRFAVFFDHSVLFFVSACSLGARHRRPSARG